MEEMTTAMTHPRRRGSTKPGSLQALPALAWEESAPGDKGPGRLTGPSSELVTCEEPGM